MDADILETQVRRLEHDLRASRATLRDEFAMAALTGLLANVGCSANPVDVASACYTLADAMLGVRQ